MTNDVFLGQGAPDDYPDTPATGRSRTATTPTGGSGPFSPDEPSSNLPSQTTTPPQGQDIEILEVQKSQDAPKNNLLLFIGAGLLLYFFVIKRK